jgi:OOP family OmpA-OmpF porin
MKILAPACASAVIALVLLGNGVSFAQEQSEAELKEIFARQMRAIAEARKDPALGATRGLKLNLVAPPEDIGQSPQPDVTTVQPIELPSEQPVVTAPVDLREPAATTVATPEPEEAPAATTVATPEPGTPSGPVLDLTGGTTVAKPVIEEPKPPVTVAVPGAPETVAPEPTTVVAKPDPSQPVRLDVPAATEAAPVELAAPQPVQHWTLPPEDQVNVRVNFAFDSAALADAEEEKLRKFCSVVDEVGVQVFRIIGHTDAIGDDGYNQRLSILRAEEVRRFFTDECKIPPARLQAIGVGEQFLLDPKRPRAAENRRVEFQALS